ncbi:MAG: glycosyltransferase family 4 protein [Desulfohalobium sp.]
MPILLLDLGNEWRGGQRQVLYLAEALHQQGEFGVRIAAPRQSPLCQYAQARGVPVLPLPGRREWHAGNWLQMVRWLRRHRSILHTNDARSAALGAGLRRLLPQNTRLVHTRRVSYPLRRGLLPNKYHAGDHLVAVSGEIGNILEKSGIGPHRLSVIHSAVDPERYPRRDPSLPWPQTPLALGCIGSLTPQKGHHVLLAALATAHAGEGLPEWRLQLLGQGPLRAKLQQQAEALGIADWVRFCGYQDSREYLAGFDLLLVPSVDGEGSSAVIKEAWASGVPVIASDLPGNQELITHRENGLVFRTTHSEDLAARMLEILSDPALAKQCVQGGWVSSRGYTPAAMAGHYLQCYRRLHL